MTDRESVITHLQIIHTWASFARERDLQFFTAKHLEDMAAWADEAIALLKEQEPMMVRLTTSTIRCPKCGKQITSRGATHREIKFCWKCGQAVKWE